MFLVSKLLRIALVLLFLKVSAVAVALADHIVLNSFDVPKAALSPEEEAFLKDHPVIRFGGGQDWDPYIIPNADGTVDGFEKDLLQLVSLATGANIEVVSGPWKEIVEKAKKRDIDGLVTSAYNADRAQHFLFSKKYLSVFPAFVMSTEDPRTVDGFEDFYGERVAILAGNQFYKSMLSEHPQITVQEFLTEKEAITAVIKKQASAALVATTSFDTHYQNFSRLIRIGHIATEYPLDLLYSIRKDWPELIAIINKGLEVIPGSVFKELYHQWFGLEMPVIPADQVKLSFSESEKAWLAANHAIRVRVGDYPPLHFYNKGPRGISVDYLDKIAEKTGIKIKYLYGIPWQEAIDLTSAGGQIDLLLGAMPTPERREKILFTEPYVSLSKVIYTRQNFPFVGSEKDLAGKTVAVEKGFVSEKQIAAKYPDIKLIRKLTTADAIQTVASAEADAYIGGLMVGTYIVRANGLNNLKVAAPSSLGPQNLSMAVRRDWPELIGIINKVIATITPDEHLAIRNKWLPPTPYEYGINKKEVFIWVAVITGFLLTGFLTVVYWNKKLAREIESRKQVEGRLAMSERRYRTLYEQSADAMLTIEDNVFVDCNAAAVEMLGYHDKSDFLNSAPWDLSPEEQMDGLGSREKAVLMMKEAIEKGAHRFEWIHLRANGEEFPVEVLLTAIPVSGKLILHTVWRDITLKKEVEKVKDELSEDLLRKNIELERFAYTVSHDLKSPLITIQGFLGILKEELKENLDEKTGYYFDHINSATSKMYALLNDLLELSRVGRVLNPKEKFSIAEVAAEALELLSGLVSERAAVVSITDNLPTIVADRVRLREVFQNLLENAIKYAKGQPEPRVEIGVENLRGKPTVFVRDNGIGIAPQFHEKIFGLFERLENEGEGTGVGLAHVRRIIELHDGHIWVESQGDGTGTTFWFTLPDKEESSH